MFSEKAPIRVWREMIFRSAELGEISKIAELEKSVWAEAAASEEQIASRIKTFQRGNFIALFEGRIVAYCSIEYVDNLREKNFSWNEITDHGFIRLSHKPEAEYIYGVNLSVHHSMNGYKLGNRMIFFGFLVAIEANKKGGFIGSRLPGFAAYKNRYPKISAEDYSNLRRNGRRRDYELNLYESQGFEIIKVMPNYFNDPASLNYGALVFWLNPFYNQVNSSLADELWEQEDFNL